MTRASPRTRFNRSRLADCLVDSRVGPAVVDDEGAPALAERLGRWLAPTDAIRLYAALHAGDTGATTPVAPAAAGLRAELARVRAALAGAVDDACSSLPGAVRGGGEGAETVEAPDLLPYLRCHFARQREMEARIGPLRVEVRQVLAGASPALRQLAALDAAMAQSLAGREREALAGLPSLLEQRLADRLSPASGGGDGRTSVREEFREILLAELDFRLLPVVGLIEALAMEETGF